MYIITVAKRIPKKIASEDFLMSTFNKDAIKAPVHAPVPGSGIPTNNNNPRNSNFLIVSLFPIALFSSFSTRPRKSFVFFINLKICTINNKINGIGIIFPMIQIGIAFAASILSRDAASSPPLSSKIGNIEMIKITASAEMYGDRFSVNHCTKTSIIPPV